ncbi:hypothetical protein BT96DRAFT_928220 [Gymnopus androsaceus JB14]|uniref:Uncharacterized protein n=1 Tax=Gymnopus androsaceus JB14 TaxID=1447944 RepID=A0A6A4GL08_9AGAR|nr:hypothetical protein BT96DRAFT_928220 [Gymnopus androsaceus JB14]
MLQFIEVNSIRNPGLKGRIGYCSVNSLTPSILTHPILSYPYISVNSLTPSILTYPILSYPILTLQ